MALAYTNVKLEIREILLGDRPTELYQVSSKGTVPVLITLDNSIIDESLDIMLWALKNDSKQTWLNENHDEDLKTINHNDTEFKKWLDKYKYHDRYPKHSRDFYREKCCDTLSRYESMLNHTKYLSGNTLGIVDIAVFPFIRQFANVDYEWFENNNQKLKYFLEEISASDLFIEIMEKYPLWNKKDKIIINKS